MFKGNACYLGPQRAGGGGRLGSGAGRWVKVRWGCGQGWGALVSFKMVPLRQQHSVSVNMTHLTPTRTVRKTQPPRQKASAQPSGDVGSTARGPQRNPSAPCPFHIASGR